MTHGRENVSSVLAFINQYTYVVLILRGKVDDENRMFSGKHNLVRFPDQIFSRVSRVNFDVLLINFPKQSTSGNIMIRRKLTNDDINFVYLLRYRDQSYDWTLMKNNQCVLNI